MFDVFDAGYSVTMLLTCVQPERPIHKISFSRRRAQPATNEHAGVQLPGSSSLVSTEKVQTVGSAPRCHHHSTANLTGGKEKVGNVAETDQSVVILQTQTDEACFRDKGDIETKQELTGLENPSESSAVKKGRKWVSRTSHKPVRFGVQGLQVFS